MTGFSAKVRAQLVERSGGVCEMCGTARADEAHHRRARSAGGTKRLETNLASNGLMLCRACHLLVEKHRDIARLCGWLCWQAQNPGDVPVMRRGELVTLNDDGGTAVA